MFNEKYVLPKGNVSVYSRLLSATCLFPECLIVSLSEPVLELLLGQLLRSFVST
jgi:hypothetical protein